MTDAVHVTRLTPVSFLERTAAVFGERIAVVDDDRRLTWAEVAERSRRLAVALQGAGLQRGDRVAVLAPNGLEVLEMHFGVPAAGTALVALNTRLLQDETAYILEHSRARLLVVDATLAELGTEAARQAGVERVLVCGPGAPGRRAPAPTRRSWRRRPTGSRRTGSSTRTTSSASTTRAAPPGGPRA